jgi:hypothetical protein
MSRGFSVWEWLRLCDVPAEWSRQRQHRLTPGIAASPIVNPDSIDHHDLASEAGDLAGAVDGVH